MALIADYAKGTYYISIPAVILILTFFALVSNVILGIIMIITGNICSLCTSTYIINLIIFILLILYFKYNSSKDDVLIALKEFFPPANSDKKAFAALAFISLFFLAFSVLSGSNIIKTRSAQDPAFNEKITALIDDFYKDEPIRIKFPESSLAIGPDNAPVKIYVFSDFLCSACYKFYLHEKFILSKYRNKVQVIYYHYPLDSQCNSYMEGTLYDNSCLASQAMAGAAANGFFEEYLYSHFYDYRNIMKNYNKDKALSVLKSASKKTGIDSEKKENFKKILNARTYDMEISAHIELGEKLKIEATPTIFIAGRKITGVPPKEFLDRVVEIELSEQNN
jgi:protein-disulfide isomerase